MSLRKNAKNDLQAYYSYFSDKLGKNAYFFKNETGAKIADVLMSVIETCVLSEINP